MAGIVKSSAGRAKRAIRLIAAQTIARNAKMLTHASCWLAGAVKFLLHGIRTGVVETGGSPLDAVSANDISRGVSTSGGRCGRGCGGARTTRCGAGVVGVLSSGAKSGTSE